MADPQRPTWSCGHPVSPDPSIEEARLHVGHAAERTREVTPVVTGAEVDTTEFCDSCSALMVRLTVGGLGDDGVVELPSILLCPDHFDVKQVVAEWREQVRKGHHA